MKIEDVDPREIMREKVRLYYELAEFCSHTEFHPGCKNCEFEYDHGGEDEDED